MRMKQEDAWSLALTSAHAFMVRHTHTLMCVYNILTAHAHTHTCSHSSRVREGIRKSVIIFTHNTTQHTYNTTHIYTQHTYTHTLLVQRQAFMQTWEFLLCICASKANLTMKLPSPSVRAARTQMLPRASCPSSSTLIVSFRRWGWMLACAFCWHCSDFHKEYWAIDSSWVLWVSIIVWNDKKDMAWSCSNWPLERTDMNLGVSDTEFFPWAFLAWTE